MHFEVPLTGVAIASSVPETFLEMLGVLDKVHVVDPKTLHAPCIQKLEEDGLITGQGSGGNHTDDWYTMIANHPTVTGVFTDSFGRGWNVFARARHNIFKPSFVQ